MTGPSRLARLERAAIGATPVVALAIVALGLRIGAGTRSRAAMVYARGPGQGRSGLAWQFALLAEEGGVREAMPGVTLDVVARARGERATWRGTTNGDGVAEAWLDLPGVVWGEAVSLEAKGAEGEVLAAGVVTWPAPPASRVGTSGYVPATRAAGALALDVLVPNGKLVPGSAEPVLVHVVDAATRAGIADAAVTFAPEPGVALDRTEGHTAKDGWITARVTAEFLLAGWTVEAKGADADGQGRKVGSWYGALPVAPGAASVALPAAFAKGTSYPLGFVLPSASPRLYVEVDDPSGCDFAAALDVTGGTASLTLPGLAEGSYVLVTSADATGAEGRAGSTLVRPFEVAASASAAPASPPDALGPAPSFARFLALDGSRRPRAAAAARRRKGAGIVLGALVVAALLETLLLLRAAARARQRLARLSEAAEDAGGAGLALAPRAAGGVAVLVLATVLGFALIAALLMVRG